MHSNGSAKPLRSWFFRTWTRRSSARSSIILRKNATTAPVVATCVWPLFIRSFATSHCMRPSTALWRSVCLPYPANATCNDLYAFSPQSKLISCLPRRTSTLGVDDVIELCCCSLCRPDYAHQRWSACAARTSCWVQARTCSAWVKDGRQDVLRFAKRPLQFCARGCENDGVNPLIRSFRLPEFWPWAPTAWGTCSKNILPSLVVSAPH